MSGIELISHIVPKNSNNFYLVEDSYLKGSVRCVSTYAEIALIPTDSRKVGSIIYVEDQNKYYKFYPTTSTVIEFLSGISSISTVNSPYTVSESDSVIICLADTGNITVNLPQLNSNFIGKSYKIKMRMDSNTSYTVGVNAYAGNTIEGSASKTLNNVSGTNSFELTAITGTLWAIISSHKI